MDSYQGPAGTRIEHHEDFTGTVVIYDEACRSIGIPMSDLVNFVAHALENSPAAQMWVEEGVEQAKSQREITP